MQPLLSDLDFKAEVKTWRDSNAVEAKGSRRGLGTTRHIELGSLGVQQMTHSGRGEHQEGAEQIYFRESFGAGKGVA